MPAPASQDRDIRLRRYLLSMGIRTLCFALACVMQLTVGWPIAAWVLVVAAVLLPYPAVIFANNIDRKRDVRTFSSPTRQLPGNPPHPMP